MIYLYTLRSLKEVASWLAGNGGTGRTHYWSGRASGTLNLTGLEPCATLGDACEPIQSIRGRWPAQPAALALQFPCPVEGSAYKDALTRAHACGFSAALRLLEAEYAFAYAEVRGGLVGNLLIAAALDSDEQMLTATVMGWTCTDRGRWLWLDLWRLIEWLPEIRSTCVGEMARVLAEDGLEMHWSGPQRATLHRIGT